jgi:hypothetical protein
MHDLGCISTTFERSLRNFLDLLPDEVKHRKVKSMGVRSHSHKEITVVGWNIGAISFPKRHRPPKEMVQVGVEWKQVRGGSHTPSFVARVHESQFVCFKMESKVNLDMVYIILSKSK